MPSAVLGTYYALCYGCSLNPQSSSGTQKLADEEVSQYWLLSVALGIRGFHAWGKFPINS